MDLKSPVVVYAVFDSHSIEARAMARELYDWFALRDDTNDQAVGVPVYVRCAVEEGHVIPPIYWADAQLNVLVVLGDEAVVGGRGWQNALPELLRAAACSGSRVAVIGAGLVPYLHRVDGIDASNVLSLSDYPASERALKVRRTVSEVIVRELRSIEEERDRLEIFISHAKSGGRQLAIRLRDSMMGIGQLAPWFDENDLPIGREWSDRLTRAAGVRTVGFIAIVTDLYPKRPWCRFEVTQARLPRRIQEGVWGVQPVVSVRDPGDTWSRDLPMLESVPHIGWPRADDGQLTRLADVIDRLLLEALLNVVHRRIAEQLASDPESDSRRVYISWVPDTWTIAQLLQALSDARPREIVYPGFGMRRQDEADLRRAYPDLEFRTYEAVMP